MWLLFWVGSSSHFPVPTAPSVIAPHHLYRGTQTPKNHFLLLTSGPHGSHDPPWRMESAALYLYTTSLPLTPSINLSYLVGSHPQILQLLGTCPVPCFSPPFTTIHLSQHLSSRDQCARYIKACLASPSIRAALASSKPGTWRRRLPFLPLEPSTSRLISCCGSL